MVKRLSQPIIAVERAMHDLRHGLPVRVMDGTRHLDVASAEFPAPANAKRLDSKAGKLSCAAIALCKHAGLIPAAYALKATKKSDILHVSVKDVLAYRDRLALALVPVSEAMVPLVDAGISRVIAFRPPHSMVEHLAVLVGKPETKTAPLVRVHSSCMTGDILGSLRCDCGNQLRESLRRMAKEGAGVLLYLNQEGRGIGIANKLRAYALQDEGLDTVEANLAMGFDADERSFLAASVMLKHLKIKRIRLLTNNPAKVAALKKLGMVAAERVPLVIPATAHNKKYLDTKASKCGHVL